MRKSNGQLCVGVLLLTCAAATWSVTHAASTAPELPDFPGRSSIVPIIGDPKIQQCWRSLLGTGSCVNSVFVTILSGRVVLTSECCGAIEGLNDYCIPKMFTFLPSGNLIPGILNNVCSAVKPAAHPPAAPPAPGH